MVFHRILDFKAGLNFYSGPFLFSRHFAIHNHFYLSATRFVMLFLPKSTNKNGCSYRTAAINNLAGTEDIGKKEVD